MQNLETHSHMNHLIPYFQELEQQAHGILGISALHLESGQKIHYKSDEIFLLCSTYKIPIAITLLQKVEQGSIGLNDLITISEYDLRPGSGSFLLELDYGAPFKLSVLNLLKLMMQYSCNSSTDIILNLLGGARTVMSLLHRLNIENLHIDTATLEAIAYWDGITQLPDDGRIKLSEYKQLESSADLKIREIHRKNMVNDRKNSGSPSSMTALLKKFLHHEIVNSELVNLLLNIMSRCKTGPNRMMSRLPKNAVISRKTGTLSGFVSEVAVIQMPFSAGQVIMSIYINNSDQSVTVCENIIAEAARFIFDNYVVFGLAGNRSQHSSN